MAKPTRPATTAMREPRTVVLDALDGLVVVGATSWDAPVAAPLLLMPDVTTGAPVVVARTDVEDTAVVEVV